MHIKIDDKELEFPNEKASVEKIINSIDETIQNSEWVVGHLSIDGLEVFDEVEMYLSEHIEQITMIDVVLIPKQQLIREILLSTGDYLQRALEGIRSLAAEFYQGPSQETWDAFDNLLEGFVWLLNTCSALAPYAEGFITFQDEINLQIVELQKALEKSDLTLLADLMTYEIAPLLERSLQQVREVQSKEVN